MALFKEIQWRRVYRQFLAAATGCLALLCGGCVVTWVSPTLSKFTEQTSLVLSTSEESWVGSLSTLASVVGPAPAMFFMHHYGCRIGLIATGAIYVCGWIFVATMQSVAMLLVGRFILGLGLGASQSLIPVYIGEIAQPQIRGILSSFFGLFFTGGFMVEYSVGPYVSYLALALISGALPLILMVGMFFMPDSPYQLVARGRLDDARASLEWLKNTSGEEVDSVLMVIKANVEMQEKIESKSSFKHLVTQRGNLKTLLLLLAMSFFQQLSGATALATYTQTIFEASGANISATLSTIINGAFMIAAGIVASGLIDLVGRRPLIFFSSAGLGLSLLSLGTYFYFSKFGDVSSFQWLPLCSLVLFTIFYGIGWGPVVPAVAAEVFANEIKGKAMFVTMSFTNLVGFFNARYFLDVSEKIGMWWCFWFFGACMISGGVFCFFFLPETKGKPDDEIQQIFHG